MREDEGGEDGLRACVHVCGGEVVLGPSVFSSLIK
jgi:hypothetical protein